MQLNHLRNLKEYIRLYHYARINNDSIYGRNKYRFIHRVRNRNSDRRFTIIVFTSWLDKEYDITVSSGEPSKYIELLLTDLNYRRKWVLKENKYIILDKEPIDKNKYDLIYTIKKKDNKDDNDFKFVIYLIKQAIDYINNLELVYNSSKED